MRAYRRRRKEAAVPVHEVPDAPVDAVDAADAVARWTAELVVPDGIRAGQKFILQPFQTNFLRDALAPGVREAALSVARKNAKSATIALLLMAYLCGPLHKPSWRGLVTSVTGELAKELRHQMEAIATVNNLPVEVKRSPTPGEISGPNRTKVTFLAADVSSTGHGLGIDTGVYDELGLVPESRRGIYQAVKSSVSARDGRTIAISIMGDPGSIMAEIKARSNDRAVVFHEFSAPADCKLDDRSAWYAANPGLGTIKSLTYMEDASRAALATPADAAAFRSLDLNLPQDPAREVILLPQQWDECVTDSPPERDGSVCVGLDIGGAVSLSACVAIWPATGRCEIWGAFADVPDLHSRGQADGIGRLYLRMEEAGELVTYPGRVTDVVAFIEDAADRLAGERVFACGS